MTDILLTGVTSFEHDHVTVKGLFQTFLEGGTAHDRYTVKALPVDDVRALLKRHGRLKS